MSPAGSRLRLVLHRACIRQVRLQVVPFSRPLLKAITILLIVTSHTQQGKPHIRRHFPCSCAMRNEQSECCLCTCTVYWRPAVAGHLHAAAVAGGREAVGGVRARGAKQHERDHVHHALLEGRRLRRHKCSTVPHIIT